MESWIHPFIFASNSEINSAGDRPNIKPQLTEYICSSDLCIFRKKGGNTTAASDNTKSPLQVTSIHLWPFWLSLVTYISSINTFQQDGLFQQHFRSIYSSVHQRAALTDTRELQVERAEGQKAVRLGFYVLVKGLFPLKMEEQFDPPAPWSGCMNKQAPRGPGAAAQGARLPVTALYNPSQHLSLQRSSGTDPSTAKLQNIVKATLSIPHCP